MKRQVLCETAEQNLHAERKVQYLSAKQRERRHGKGRGEQHEPEQQQGSCHRNDQQIEEYAVGRQGKEPVGNNGKCNQKDRETLQKRGTKLSLCRKALRECLTGTADRKDREKRELKAALKELKRREEKKKQKGKGGSAP